MVHKLNIQIDITEFKTDWKSNSNHTPARKALLTMEKQPKDLRNPKQHHQGAFLGSSSSLAAGWQPAAEDQ